MTPLQLSRFVSYIDTSGNYNKEKCWIWTGPRFQSGYGVFHLAGRNMRAHRVAWITFVGKIPRGMHVCHGCDVPLCVNPSHLWIGTHRENMKDMAEKGRTHPNPLRGGEAKNAKLKPENIVPIRLDPRMHKDIAAEYGVSSTLIARVKSRKAWAHI